MRGFASWAAIAAAGAAVPAAGPAAAAELDPGRSGVGEHRAAFAGAVVRVELGGRRGAKAPRARLGIGFSPYRRDASGFLSASGGPRLPLEAGLADGRLAWFVGGETLSGLERRLGAAGSSTKTLLIIGGIAAGAAAAVLLLDGDGEDGPCPPGVEVCAQ